MVVVLKDRMVHLASSDLMAALDLETEAVVVLDRLVRAVMHFMRHQVAEEVEEHVRQAVPVDV